MKLTRKTFAVGATVLAAGLATAGSASAAPNASLSETTIPSVSALSPTHGHQVTVTLTGFAPNATIFLQQCYRDAEPTAGFDFTIDCDNSTSSTNVATDANGNATKTITLFGGDEPSGLKGWGCGPDATNDPDNGLFAYDPCFVRVAPDTKDNYTSDQFLSFTYGTTEPPPEVPEVPLNILLPASAAVLLAGGYVFTRKRNARSAA
jgi:hypothetical protein